MSGIQTYELDPRAACSVPTVEVHQFEASLKLITDCWILVLGNCQVIVNLSKSKGLKGCNCVTIEIQLHMLSPSPVLPACLRFFSPSLLVMPMEIKPCQADRICMTSQPDSNLMELVEAGAGGLVSDKAYN